MTRRIGAIAVGLIAFASGCAITYDGALELRKENDPKRIREGEQDCLDFLTNEVGIVPRRAVVMQTAAILAKRNDFKKVEAALYKNVVARLQAEEKSPRVDPDKRGPDDAPYLRAWAVHCLGLLEDEDLIEHFIECVTQDDLNEATGCRAQIAALDALVPLLEPLRSSASLRNKLLAAIPTVRAKYPQQRVANGQGAARDSLLDFFVIELKTLDNVTNVIQQCSTNDVAPDPWIEALTWAYQILHEHVTKQEKAITSPQYSAAIAAVTPVVHHADSRVRRAARTILLDVAPGTLFDDLVRAAREKPDASREDLEQLAGMVPAMSASSQRYAAVAPTTSDLYFAGVSPPTLNEVALLSSAAFATTYAELTQATFQFCASADAAGREYLYSRLFEFDPLLLAKHLVQRERTSLQEPPAERAQHVRYLGSLLGEPRVLADAKMHEILTVSLSHGLWVDDPTQQKQVASYLLASRPDVLVASGNRVMREIPRMSAAGARGLLELYLESLARSEKAKGIAAAATSPYVTGIRGGPSLVMQAVFERPEATLRAKVIAFLERRDPAQLIAILALVLGRQNEPRAFELAALNDVLLGRRAELRESTIKIGVDALASALTRCGEDEALVIARCLAELQHEAAIEALDVYRRSTKCRSESVKAIVVAAIAAWGK